MNIPTLGLCNFNESEVSIDPGGVGAGSALLHRSVTNVNTDLQSAHM